MVKIKIAIISDIHANSVALEEIIKDAKKSGAEEFLFLGDQVNDLPFGNETLEIVKKISDKVLKGNKEQYLIEYETEKYYWDNIQFKNTIFLAKDNHEKAKLLIVRTHHFRNDSCYFYFRVCCCWCLRYDCQCYVSKKIH